MNKSIIEWWVEYDPGNVGINACARPPTRRTDIARNNHERIGQDPSYC
jgi:hypothetical protein